MAYDDNTRGVFESGKQALSKLLFEKISMRGRGFIAATELIGSIDGLKQSINERNEFVREFMGLGQDRTPILFLGLKDQKGQTDERFKDNVKGLSQQTDDCIFFSKLLVDDLGTYGNLLRRRHFWHVWRRTRRLRRMNWSIVPGSLVPTDDDYRLWLNGFNEKPQWWKRPFVHSAPKAKNSEPQADPR